MSKLKNWALPVFAGIFFFTLSGCESEGPAERAGEKVDKAIEKAGEKIDEAVEESGEALEEAGDKMEETLEKQ